MYTFTAELENFETNLWTYHIKVPPKIATRLLENGHRRVICCINGNVEIHCALMPSGDHRFIMINKKVREQLAWQLGSQMPVTLIEDQTKYGMPMPEEFEVLLAQDDEGNDWFQALTPGKQRTLIHLVAKVKNVDSRINKGLAILYHLKEQSGQVNFKWLNQTIKEYNQRGRLH